MFTRWPTALWLKVLGCQFTVLWSIWVLTLARHQPLSIGSYESRKVFCARVNARKKWLSSSAMCGQEIEVRAMAPTLILIQTLFPLLDNFVTTFRSSPSFLTNHSRAEEGRRAVPKLGFFAPLSPLIPRAVPKLGAFVRLLQHPHVLCTVPALHRTQPFLEVK